MKTIKNQTKLEKEILEWLINKAPELGEQIKQCTVSERRYSGAGFFFDLSVPKNIKPLEIKGTIQGPEIKSKELSHGAGSILFLKDGYIDMLEVFTYADSFPEKLENFELKSD